MFEWVCSESVLDSVILFPACLSKSAPREIPFTKPFDTVSATTGAPTITLPATLGAVCAIFSAARGADFATLSVMIGAAFMVVFATVAAPSATFRAI